MADVVLHPCGYGRDVELVSTLVSAFCRCEVFGLTPFLMICKVAVGGCVRQLQREIVCFEAAGRGWREGWQGMRKLIAFRKSIAIRFCNQNTELS